MSNIFKIELAKDDLNQALNTWVSYLKNEKRVSSHTVDAYYRDINSFIHFLIEHVGGPLSLRNLETLIASDFRAFMARKKRDGNSTRTIARLMSSIRSLFEYFEKIEIIKNIWSIILSDGTSDAYEENLMRRLAGLLYIDAKTMGDIKLNIQTKLKQ